MRKLLLLCFFVLLMPAALFAQANAADAAVNGYIFDASGSVLPGVRVVLSNVATGISQETTADNSGYYRFPLVRVGAYELTVSAPGFQKLTQKNIILSVGQEARIDLTLKIGDAVEAVEVQAGSQIIDTGTSTIGAVLDHQQVENLPIVARQIYNFLLLSPGVIGMPTSTFSTTQFSFGGNERSQWNLDGLDDTQHGGTRQIRLIIVTPEAVSQTQTLSSGYSAEFGRAAGGQINVLLKSGTNQFHGSALGQWRPKGLQAIPTLQKTQPDRSWNDEAFTLGGPILHRKLFFFGQFENNPYTLPNAITITQANAAALGLATSQIGTAPFGETYRTLVAKVDYTLNEKNSGFVQFVRFTNHQPNTASGLSITDRGSHYIDHQNGGGAQLATVLSPTLLNEIRVGTIQRDTENSPVTSNCGDNVLINITSVASIGCSTLSTTATTERSTTALDNMTWTHGHHTVKFGAEFDHELFDSLSSTAPTFTFNGVAASGDYPAVSSLDDYLNTINGVVNPITDKPYTYATLVAYSGTPVIRTAFNFVNGFLQDEFRINQHFAVNYGARYEAILFPVFDSKAPYALSRSVPNDYRDIAPRIGITWSPGRDSLTVIRAAFGLYYDIPGLATFYNAGLVNGHRLLQYDVQGTADDAPVYPNVPDFSGTTHLVAPSITAFDQNFHNTYQQQANLQIERSLGDKTKLTLGYQYAALRHGLYYADTNLTMSGATLSDGRPVYDGTSKRPNSSFGAINTIHSGTNTNFNGVFIAIQKQLSRGLEFSANYEYSHALDNNIGEGGSISDPSNIHRDYGNADSNVGHNFTLQGIYTTRFTQPSLRWLSDFEVSTMTYINSGFPINEIAGTDLNNDGVTNDRPVGISRNSLTGPGLHEVDGQVKRYFTLRDRYHLSVFLQTENALNSNNYSCTTTSGCTGAVTNAVNSSSFLKETSARTSRNIQIGASFKF